jgi:SAM-dependent methyltransferase
MHYYEPGAFEIVRVAYLLANAKAVISEVNPGEAVDGDLLPGVVAAKYDDLTDACRSLVEDDSRRYALEQAGLASIQSRDEARILKGALDEAFTAKLNTAAESKVEVINSGPIRLNLGCGRGPQLDWTNIDSVTWPGVDIVADLDRCREIPLPFDESSVDEMLLSHVIEHLRDPLGLMQELHRVAKPGATLTIRVPYGSSDDAWEDPTHVRPYFLGSFGYFSQPFYWRADYGYRGDWRTERRCLIFHRTLKDLEFNAIMEMIRRERNLVKEMVVVLTAVKPIRKPLRELQEPSPITFDFVD